MVIPRRGWLMFALFRAWIESMITVRRRWNALAIASQSASVAGRAYASVLP